MRSFLFAASFVAAVAAAADAQVRINEFYYDAPSGDDGKVFIELSGPPGLDISGYRLVQVQGNNTQCGNYVNSVVLPAGSMIGADGLYLVADGDAVGNTQVAVDFNHNFGQPDLIASNADFENGPDAITLLDASLGYLDSLLYGVVPCQLDQTTYPVGETFGAPDVFAGFSLSRHPQGFDTDNNQSDFYENGLPSPGNATTPPSALIFTNVGGTGSQISLATGGQLDLRMRIAQPNELYLVLVSVTPPTGSDPFGVPFDPITDVFLSLTALPNPLVVNFFGNLDATGAGLASLVLPPNVATVPFAVPFYFVAVAPVNAQAVKTNVVTFSLAP